MKEYTRRNFYVPIELDDEITRMADKYNYKSKKDMYVELLELGILKFEEDYTMKNVMIRLINKIDYLLSKIED